MLTLTPVTPAVSDLMLRWRNQPEIAQWMYSAHVITPAEHASWFTHILNDPTVRYWTINWMSQPVGTVNLARISTAHRRCDWAIYIGEASARGTGAAEGAVVLSIGRAVREVGVERIVCEAIASNERAIRLYERMGFRRESYLRAHVRRGNLPPVDVVSMALLAEEWLQLEPGHRDRLSARGVLHEGDST